MLGIAGPVVFATSAMNATLTEQCQQLTPRLGFTFLSFAPDSLIH